MKTNKIGRPSLYDSIDLAKVKELANLGLTDEQISRQLNICHKTLCTYKEKHIAFLQAIKEGKEDADGKVVRSLWERANGYSHPEDKVFCEKGKVTVVPIIKHYPPDPTAMIFWLKNRRSFEWRDRVEVEHSGYIENSEERSAIKAEVIDFLREAGVKT